ncbi:uncharacterized protein LOC141536250 isoform X2 [Cotesia typhae]|uniref:uncharacterized protein LOC141536250 isoform X2 n=2 Tax=Cotesia typhae TaxID=2053667 RepID=UPI003D6866E8
MTINKSALFTIKNVFELWAEAGIPTCTQSSAIRKLVHCHTLWNNLVKSKNKKQSHNKTSHFRVLIEKLFDVAHHNATKLIDKDKKLFLEGQRQLNRRGFININPQNNMEVDLISDSDVNQPNEIEKNQSFVNDTGLLSQKTDSSLSRTSHSISGYEDDVKFSQQPKKKDVVTPLLASTLDRANVTDRNATYIIAATLTSVGLDINDYNISHMTVHRKRESMRENVVKNLQNNLALDNCVLHWDGKIMPDNEEPGNVDRLAIVITASGQETFLEAPKISSGTGENQASVIVSKMRDWSVTDKVKALCFDTTATNTGVHNGSCVLIEQALKRELIYLPCRHHILELVLRSVFESYWPTSSGPNVPIFTRFKDKWSEIDQQKYVAGISDQGVFGVIGDTKEQILILLTNYSQISQPRGDYRELLELAFIFLGAIPPNGVMFKRPGAVHHASNIGNNSTK